MVEEEVQLLKSAFKSMANFQVMAYPGIHKDEITSVHVMKYGSHHIEDWKVDYVHRWIYKHDGH